MSDLPIPDTPRVLGDAQTMRALSHPVRLALLDALQLHGPLTATEAGERIGETPTTCSFHLRQLHRFGFVEEVGGGKGRARPWRRVQRGIRFSTQTGDAETRVAASALSQMYLEHNLGHLERWTQTRDAYPSEWRESATSSAYRVWLTAAELAELEVEINALLSERFPQRADDSAARPPGARLVEVLTNSFPVDQPNGGS